MKVLALIAVMLLGMALVGCAAESPAAMIASAKDLDAKFLKSFNTQDLNNVMAVYWSSPDLVVISPDGQLCRGWNAAKDMYDRELPKMKGCRLELTESHFAVEGETVVSWGLWKMTLPVKEGQPSEMRGVYTEVAAKRLGSWVYIVDHPSLTLPPAPAAEVKSPAKK